MTRPSTKNDHLPPQWWKKNPTHIKGKDGNTKSSAIQHWKEGLKQTDTWFLAEHPGIAFSHCRNVTRRRSHKCHSNKCRVKPLTYVLQNKLLVSTHVPEPGVITPINILFSFLQFRPKAHKNSAWPWTCACSPPQFLPWACLASGCRRPRPQVWRNSYELQQVCTEDLPSLKLTVRTSQEAIPQGNNRIPTIHFQVLWLLVSGRVWNFFLRFLLLLMVYQTFLGGEVKIDGWILFKIVFWGDLIAYLDTYMVDINAFGVAL